VWIPIDKYKIARPKRIMWKHFRVLKNTGSCLKKCTNIYQWAFHTASIVTVRIREVWTLEIHSGMFFCSLTNHRQSNSCGFWLDEGTFLKYFVCPHLGDFHCNFLNIMLLFLKVPGYLVFVYTVQVCFLVAQV